MIASKTNAKKNRGSVSLGSLATHDWRETYEALRAPWGLVCLRTRVQHPRTCPKPSKDSKRFIRAPHLPHGIYRVASLLTSKSSINEAFDLKGKTVYCN